MRRARLWWVLLGALGAGSMLIGSWLDGAAFAHGREPATWTRCICVDGVSLEIVEGSSFGPPGSGRLNWPGAEAVESCRPEQLPVGAPGEKSQL